MKQLLYIFLLSAACMTATAASRTEEYAAKMESLLAQYDAAKDAAGRKAALDAMTALDKSYNGEAIVKMWKALDEKTATASDLRRTGLAMAAGHEKEACKWCFRKGAEEGDPYCANRILIEQLTLANNPNAASYLYPLIKSYTLPLLHNMALALYVENTAESRKIARELAERFFELSSSTKKKNFDVFDRSEYVDYLDSEALKLAGRCWRVSVITDPGATLRRFYEADK